jgi:hypothetical protein
MPPFSLLFRVPPRFVRVNCDAYATSQMAAEASDLRGPATAESSAASVHPSVAGLTNRAAGGASGGAAAAPPATLMYLPEPVANAHAAAAAAPSQAPATAPKGDAGDGDGSSRFICHICLNSPDKPVVTVCGHLHWSVLQLAPPRPSARRSAACVRAGRAPGRTPGSDGSHPAPAACCAQLGVPLQVVEPAPGRPAVPRVQSGH